MAKAKMAPTRKNISVSINENIPYPASVNANAGDTVTFVNFDATEKVVRFALDKNGNQFHPIGLIIPPGPHSSATIVTVDPKNGSKSSIAFYTVNTADEDGSLQVTPEDDTYQVIVGSSGS